MAPFPSSALSLLVLALLSWSFSTPVQAASSTTIELYYNNNCAGAYYTLTLPRDECVSYFWSNQAAEPKTFSAFKARIINCDNGTGSAAIMIWAYNNSDCSDTGMMFSSISVSTGGNPGPALIDPNTCNILSGSIVPDPFLYAVKYKSYECDGIYVPTPAPQPPTPTLPPPTPTPMPNTSVTIEIFPDEGCVGTPTDVTLGLQECVPYFYTYTVDGTTTVFRALKAIFIRCDNGNGSAAIMIWGYNNQDCLDSGSQFAQISPSGTPIVLIDPWTCNFIVRRGATVSPSQLYVLRYKSYQCNDLFVPTPGPSPTPSPSPAPVTPSPTPSPTQEPTASPAPVPVCIDAEWIEANGLDKVHATDGVGQLLCIMGLDDIPCGTPHHVLEVTVNDYTQLLTYEEVCMTRQCISKRGRFNGVLHSDANKLPGQQGHRLTTLAHRGTTWSGIENRFVRAAQKLGVSYVNDALTYLQRRNSVKHFV